jgi:hypothetical protein
MPKKPVKKVAEKAVKKTAVKAEKKIAKSQFTVTVFTERGARSHKKIYENAGYKFVKSEVTPNQVFLTFEDNMDP